MTRLRRFAIHCLLGGALSLLVAASLGRDGVAAQRTAPPPAGDDVQRRLETIVGASWTEMTLRQVLRHFPERWGLDLFLDRRVDPDQVLEFRSSDQSLGDTLHALAHSLGLEIARVDDVLYLGPPGVAQRVATLAAVKQDELLSRPDFTPLATRREPLRWETLAQPRQLVRQLAESAGVSISNLDLVPHDLWWENDLPPLPWSHRMTLLLAGFDLTFRPSPDGSQLQLIPMPTDVALERTYTLPGNAAARMRQLQASVPEAQMRRVGNRALVRGSAADHQTVRRLLGEADRRPASTRPAAEPNRTAPAETRYTLRAANRIGAILQAVAQRSQLRLDYPPELRPQLDKNVTLEVEGVSLEELLDRLLSEHGLAYELKPPSLRIKANR